MIMVATLIVLALTIFYIHLKTKRTIELVEKFPGPKAWPIVGNIFNFTVDNHEAAKRLITESHAKYGDIFRIKILYNYQFMVADPKVYEIILSSTTNFLAKNVLYGFLKPWLRNGLILSTGQHWHSHRKIITPAFHFKILEQFVEVFDRQSQVLVEKLQKRADGSVVDVVEYLTLMALDIVCETAMGTQINAQTDSESHYAKAVDSMTRILSLRFSSMWRRSNILYSIFGHKEERQQTENIRIMHDFTNKIIVKRRESLMQSKDGQDIEKSNDNDDDDIGQSKKMAFLDVMLQSTIDGKPLSNDEILEEVDTFMFAGHDTTTAAISAILYVVSRHKDVQDKLFNEIVEIFGSDKNAPITYRQLQQLKYMDLVIKETFRLYPPVPAVGRYIDKEIELDDGRVIPADINVTLNYNITFMNPKYFKDPERFDPERFSAENTTEKSNPFAYIPFSAGSRNCIGQKFALLDIKAVVSKVLRHFELLPNGEEPNISFEIVSRATNGMQMGLTPRVY